MRISNSIAIIAAALVLVSCDKNRVFDEYKDVGSAWHQDSLVRFDLPALEATKKYNMYLTLPEARNEINVAPTAPTPIEVNLTVAGVPEVDELVEEDADA